MQLFHLDQPSERRLGRITPFSGWFIPTDLDPSEALRDEGAGLDSALGGLGSEVIAAGFYGLAKKS